MAKRRGKGHWVKSWVPDGCTAEVKPLPKWETLPAAFYSLKKSLVACRLFLRDLRPELYDYCVANEVLPPERMRKWRLEKWIEDHRTSAEALVTFPGILISDPKAGEIEREEFFRQLARREPKRTRQDSITGVLICRPLS